MSKYENKYVLRIETRENSATEWRDSIRQSDICKELRRFENNHQVILDFHGSELSRKNLEC